MSHRKNFTTKYLFSTFGILLILVLLLALNSIMRNVNIRLDLTEDKLYTLSKGTRNILKGLENKVTLRFYRSKKENLMPVYLHSFVKRIEDLLEEYVENSNGKLVLEKYDPLPDSDAEDSAIMDGISAQLTEDGNKFFLGLAVTCPPNTSTLPIFSPMHENTLEYDISSAITEVAWVEKTVIGIITQLPVMGESASPYFIQRNQVPKPPWIFVQELQKKYEVRNLGTDIPKIPADINLLIIIHPKNLSEQTLFSVDQFLLSGGRLIIAVDTYCIVEAKTSPVAMFEQQTPQPGTSSIPELFSAWGIELDENKVVIDFDYAMRDLNNINQAPYPTVLNFTESLNESDDVTIANLKSLNMIFAGAFKGSPEDGICKTILVNSSERSQMLASFMAESPSSILLENFTSDNTKKDLIIRLSGTFKTAFPDGPPEKENKKDNKESKQKNVPKGEKDEDKMLRESSKESSVLLISDVDMLFDYFCVTRHKIFGADIIEPFNDNLNFIENAVDQLSGENDLIAIRSHKVTGRPFTRIIKMQAAAQEKFQKEISEIEDKREAAERRLAQLQQTKEKNQRFILSPEQKKEIENYRTEVARTNKELKRLRKKLRKEIDKLQFNIQAVNIALIPGLIVLFGIGLCFYKDRRRKKR